MYKIVACLSLFSFFVSSSISAQVDTLGIWYPLTVTPVVSVHADISKSGYSVGTRAKYSMFYADISYDKWSTASPFNVYGVDSVNVIGTIQERGQSVSFGAGLDVLYIHKSKLFFNFTFGGSLVYLENNRHYPGTNDGVAIDYLDSVGPFNKGVGFSIDSRIHSGYHYKNFLLGPYFKVSAGSPHTGRSSMRLGVSMSYLF